MGAAAVAAGSSTTVLAPCKVNLYLGVRHETDARGYHRVDSLMVPVALFDEVVVEDAPELVVSFSPALSIPVEKSGVWRAATMLAEALGEKPDVRVSVTRNIPGSAGLGGSSADAGAVLRALAGRWGVDARDPRVVDAARRVGADVAFFLDPRPALLGGAGDVLERTFPGLEVPIALVMPRAEGGSTPAAYAEFDRTGVEPAGCEALCRALDDGSLSGVAASLANNLAPVARALCPEAGEVEAWLRERPGVLAAQVTGSGTCSFAICESREAADAVAEGARALGWRSWSTKTLGSAAKVC